MPPGPRRTPRRTSTCPAWWPSGPSATGRPGPGSSCSPAATRTRRAGGSCSTSCRRARWVSWASCTTRSPRGPRPSTPAASALRSPPERRHGPASGAEVTAPGARVADRYLLRSRLGGGAMGAVWLARDELLGRDVAVKQVLIPVGSDPESTEAHRGAAMREGRIAARITHPHAVSVYDMVDDGGTPWLVMEYLPSRSLAQVLADRGTLPVQQVAQIGAQVADALIATHAAGVVHRDVKPGNILIGEGGRSEGLVKITDFGISRARGDVSLTQTGVVKGTPAYLAPEVARGQEPDEASDVYSLGATIYACLEGSPPFGMTEDPLEMLYRVAGGDFQRPRNAGALARPLMRMLHSDPAKRPSMTEVRDQLAQLAAGPDRDVTEVLTARTPLTPTLTEVNPVGDRALPAVGPPARTAVEPVPAAAVAAEPTAPQSTIAPQPAAVPPGPPAAEPPAAQPVANGPGPRRRRGRLA